MRHVLRSPSSFIVVTLRSTRHGACLRCGTPLKSFDEAVEHWEKELGINDGKKEEAKAKT